MKSVSKESTRKTKTWVEREDEVVWTELIWLRIGTSGGFL
jgi:hypothetical protein